MITAAVAEDGRKGEIRQVGTISNELHALEPNRLAASEIGCEAGQRPNLREQVMPKAPAAAAQRPGRDPARVL
jgi:hypothetical protein